MEHVELLQRVYSAPLSAFTATRNSVAKEIEATDRELAERIKKLRKPTAAVWAIDQLALIDEEGITNLIAAGADLRAATENGDVAAIQRSNKDRRDQVKRSTDVARSILEEAGLGASTSTLEKISNTLYVAAGEPEVAEKLRAGILDRELDASSMDALGSMDVGDIALVETPVRAPDLATLKATVHELERTAAQLELEADDREAEARRSRRAAQDARAAAEAAAARLNETKGT